MAQKYKGIQQYSVCKLYSLFKLYAEYIMWNATLDESQTGIDIAGELSATSHMLMIPL